MQVPDFALNQRTGTLFGSASSIFVPDSDHPRRRLTYQGNEQPGDQNASKQEVENVENLHRVRMITPLIAA